MKREESMQNPEIAESVRSIPTPEQQALAKMPISIPAEHVATVESLVGTIVRDERRKLVHTINTLATQMDERGGVASVISAATLRGVASSIDLLP